MKALSLIDLASSPDSEEFSTQVMTHALTNQPMAPSIYKYAFYLYGRTRLAWGAATRIMKGQAPNPSKRTGSPDDMSATRTIRVPVRFVESDTNSVHPFDCECMMVDDKTLEAYALQAEDKPGLAILDSGCSRTMRGAEWAAAFEAELKKRDLQPNVREKKQLFPVGVGKVQGCLH